MVGVAVAGGGRSQTEEVYGEGRAVMLLIGQRLCPGGVDLGTWSFPGEVNKGPGRY